MKNPPSLMLAKSAHQSSKTFIAYLNSSVDEKLLEIVGKRIDCIVQLNEENLGKILHEISTD